MLRATSTAAGAVVSTGRPAQRATATRGGRVLAVIAAIALGIGARGLRQQRLRIIGRGRRHFRGSADRLC